MKLNVARLFRQLYLVFKKLNYRFDQKFEITLNGRCGYLVTKIQLNF